MQRLDRLSGSSGKEFTPDAHQLSYSRIPHFGGSGDWLEERPYLTVSTFTARPSLANLLDQCRAAVVARAAGQESPEAVQAFRPSPEGVRPQRKPEAPSRPSCDLPAPLPAVAFRPSADDLPAPRVLASYPSADDLAEGLNLSRPALKVWRTVYALAVDTGKARGYTVRPDQITYHCPQVSVAAAVGYSLKGGGDNGARQLRNVIPELEAAGLLDTGSHAQTVLGRSMWDGSLWSVKTRREADPPRIRADEWRHNWRPSFSADVLGKTGALKEISELLTQEGEKANYYEAAKRRAAVPESNFPAAVSSSEIPAPAGLRAVAERVCGLFAFTNLRRRAVEVGHLADAICSALNEPERRRYWCKVLHEALKDAAEGRGNALLFVAEQFRRIVTDLEEGAPWRNAGAVLAARLRGAS